MTERQLSSQQPSRVEGPRPAERLRGVEKFLGEKGLRRYTRAELSVARRKITGELVKKAEGDASIAYRDNVTGDKLSAVPDGKKVLATNWGGTHQKTSIISKEGGELIDTVINREPFTDKSKPLKTEELARVIGDHILMGAATLTESERNEFGAVGVSVGFPVSYVEDSEIGLDARLTANPQNWNVTDIDLTTDLRERPRLGKPLLEYLQDHGLPVKKVFIKHDALATGDDTPLEAPDGNLPVSFVLGTGSSAQVNGQELGVSAIEDAFPQSEIFEHMAEAEYIPEKNKKAVRARIGGQRTKLQVAAAIDLCAEEGLLERAETAEEVRRFMQNKENGSILSQLASGNLSREQFNAQGMAELSIKDYEVLTLASAIALEQAGQVSGTIIAAIMDYAGYDGSSEQVIPVAGSVINKGIGVKETAKETIDALIPDNNISLYSACDRKGIGAMALSRS